MASGLLDSQVSSSDAKALGEEAITVNHHAFLGEGVLDSVSMSVQRGESSKCGMDMCLQAALPSSPNDAEKMRVTGLTISDRSFSGILGIGGEQRRGD